MIRWCAHCQKYLGEKPPLDDYAVTHSVCSDCAQTYNVEDGRISEQTRQIAEFYHSLLASGKRGDSISMPGVLRTARDLNIRPFDLLVGILQPALCAIGKAWEDGEIMAATEHRFTAVVQSIVEHLDRAPDSEQLRNSDSPDVLIVAADGNHHFLGLMMLEAFLQMHQIRSRVIYPGIPTEEVLLLASRLRPLVLGISLSLAAQESVLSPVNAWLESQPESQRPVCLAGGYWARQRTQSGMVGQIRIASDPEEILKALHDRSSNVIRP